MVTSELQESEGQERRNNLKHNRLFLVSLVMIALGFILLILSTPDYYSVHPEQSISPLICLISDSLLYWLVLFY